MPPLRRARVNRRLAQAMLLLAAVVGGAVLTRPTSWVTSTYPTKAIPTLRSLIARDPGARILADVRFADWLIWKNPAQDRWPRNVGNVDVPAESEDGEGQHETRHDLLL